MAFNFVNKQLLKNLFLINNKLYFLFEANCCDSDVPICKFNLLSDYILYQKVNTKEFNLYKENIIYLPSNKQLILEYLVNEIKGG